MKLKFILLISISNYGALLQAFELANYIKSITGSEVYFSNYHPLKFKYYEFLRPLILQN